MELKYYKYDGENYVLQRTTGMTYFAAVILLLCGVGGIVYFAITGGTGGLVWAAVWFGLIGLMYYRQRYVNIAIQPSTRRILVKHGSKVHREYPFTSFLNFQKTRIRTNGITSQWHASMYVDENGKNKNILLGVVFRQKAADHLIAETDSLLKAASDKGSAFTGAVMHQN